MNVLHSLLESGEIYSAGPVGLSGLMNRPITPGGCSLWICTAGKAILSVNFKKYLFKAKDALFIFTGTICMFHRISDDFAAFACTASEETETEAAYNIPWDFYDFLYENPVCTPDRDQYEFLLAWSRQMKRFALMKDLPGWNILIRNSFQNLFLAVNHEIRHSPFLRESKKSRSRDLFDKFYVLLQKNFKRERGPKFYADRLCISPYYLYKITRKEFGTSPKEFIDLQIVLAVKMYLSGTDLPVNRIAAELNFEDASYMNRFFKRRTGTSLSEYRKQFK